jgi:hypothetical protein
MTEEALTGEETVTGERETIVAGASEVGIADPGKCTRLYVPTAVLRLKFRSNQLKADRFTVEIAFLTTEVSKNSPTWVLIRDIDWISTQETYY